MKKLKILHIGPVKNSSQSSGSLDVTAGLGVDGPSRSILGLAQALAAEGVESGVLSTKPFQSPSDGFANGVKFLTPYVGRKYNFFIPVRKWLQQIEDEFGKPDLVNFHDVYDLFSCTLASAMQRRGWKYIVTPRGGLRQFAQKRDSYKKKIANPLFFNRYLRKALFIHTLAQGEADDVHVFDPRLQTVVVPNGLPKQFLSFCDTLSNSDSQPQKESGEIVFGFIGQMYVEIKGLDLLLKAIKKLQSDGLGQKCRFIFVGPVHRGDDQECIDRLMSELPSPDKVEWVGSKYGKDKWDFMNRFDVFVLPSRTEGMPVAGLEAMACGKPCLFSKGSNMVNFIEKANGGWSCGETTQSIYESLVKVSRMSPATLKEHGKNARNFFEANFTWDHVVKQYMEVLNNYSL